MISRVMYSVVFLSAFNLSVLHAQIFSAPFEERFDTVLVPRLPVGWTTTTIKTITGDFSSTTSTPSSAPNAIVSTDAKTPQSLITPTISFAGKIAGTLEFYERRTSSHNSGLLVEAVLTSDTVHAIQIGDTLKNSGSTNYLLRSLQLPSALNNQPAVRLRWRVVGNGSGATGTLRIDDVVITVQKAIDLSIAGIQFLPVAVRSGENLSVRVTVVNRALAGMRSFLLQLFDDKNFDSLTTPEERIDEQEVQQSFVSAESVAFTFHYPAVNAGNHRLVAKLILFEDEDTSNNTASSTIFVGYPPRSIIINEIMYAPTTGPEWLECVNNFADTISLSQWKIGDNTTSRSVITLQSIRIAPRQLFIITKDSSVMYYFPGISVPVIKSSFATLNNDADAAVIADPTGFAVDSVAYKSSWGGTNGKSLERIDTASASNQPGNWGSSRYPPYATPGTVNSVSKKERDLSVEEIFLSTMSPVVDHEFKIVVIVKNIGRESIVQSTVRFFLAANNDPQPGELIDEMSLSTLLPSDSQIIIRPVSIAFQGAQRIFIFVETPRDDDSLNNSKGLSFVVGVQPHSIIINEIMYAPVGDMPEWVEFYNASTSVVNVGGWKISDGKTKSQSVLAGAQSIIQPGSYFLATTDSSLENYFTVSVPLFVEPFSALHNTTPDAVVLFDSRGVVMDSVWYTPAWGGANGNSLERVDYGFSSTDSANWRSSLPTPGIENNAAKKDFDLAITNGSAKASEKSLTLAATVHNSGRRAVAGFIVRFYYDAVADSIVTPVKLMYAANGGSLAPSDSMIVQFNWQTTAKGKIPIICVADFPGDQRISNNTIFFSGVNRFSPQSVVINEILYEPLAGYSEFIELYNRSADTIDVQGWKIMDAPSSSANRIVNQFPNESLLLFPNQFIVVAADSSIFMQYPLLKSIPAGLTLVTHKDLSLNNSGDDVILADQINTMIDSVRYSPSWHNPSLNTPTAGRSIERINPSFESNDKRNWSTSVAPSGATPLQTNSIYTKSVPSAAGLSLSPNPFSPDNDGFEDILAITYSLPSTISMIRVRCFDVQGRLVRTLANNEPVASSGTLLWNGLDDNNRRVRIGMYIILFEALDAAGGIDRVMKDVVVVATKL